MSFLLATNLWVFVDLKDHLTTSDIAAQNVRIINVLYEAATDGGKCLNDVISAFATYFVNSLILAAYFMYASFLA